jgi:iron complex outermembrane receptor protein
MSRALLLAGAAPFALLAAPVLAQEAPAPATAEAESVSASDSESAGGNAIIVTARRRQENVQTVPLAISVVEAAKLDAQGTYNIARLTQIQPTLQFYSQNPRNTFINIRGIGAPFGLTNDGFEQGVGIYIDDVYYNRIASATLTSSMWSRSKRCAGRRARSMARTPPPARSTSQRDRPASTLKARPKSRSAT